MTNLGALNERLQSRLRQDREMIEEQAKAELQILSRNLGECSQNALNTIESAIQSRSEEITLKYNKMLESIEGGGQSLNQVILGAWLRNFLIGAGLVLGIAVGAWGVTTMFSNKLIDLQTAITELETRRAGLEKTLDILQNKTWGISLSERKEGRFIILKPGKTLNPDWTIGKAPAWRLE